MLNAWAFLLLRRLHSNNGPYVALCGRHLSCAVLLVHEFAVLGGSVRRGYVRPRDLSSVAVDFSELHPSLRGCLAIPLYRQRLGLDLEAGLVLFFRLSAAQLNLTLDVGASAFRGTMLLIRSFNSYLALHYGLCAGSPRIN